MDFLTQQTCMARLDEPQFYASDIVTWFGGCPTRPQHPASSPPRHHEDTVGPSTGADADDDDDDDADGALRSESTDEWMTDMFASTSIAPTPGLSATALAPTSFPHGRPSAHPSNVSASQRQHDGFAIQPTPLQDLIGLGGYIPNPASILGSHHPRPLSEEIWEEEDGRRLRFALEGDANHDVPQFAPSTNSDETRVGPVDHTPVDSHLRQNHTASHEWQWSHARDASIWSSSRVSDSHLAMPDQEGLAVDDPKRNYDFSDFLLDWKWHTTCTPGMPPTDYIRNQSGPAHQRYITSDDIAAGREDDIQGIDWPSLRCKRADAFAARRALNPSQQYRVHSWSASDTQHAPQLDRQYTFKSFNPAHRARFSHYQLRNVLATSSQDSVYYATRNKVIKTSLACPTLSETAMDLPKPRHDADNFQTSAGFRITCLSTTPTPTFPSYQTPQVLLAGGFEGEYALQTLDSSIPTPGPTHLGTVTRAHNNLITHIQTHQTRYSTSTPYAALSSNDHTVRLLNTATNTFTAVHSYETPINSTAISPDSRLRLLVGDTPHALITDAERGDVLVTLRHHTDHGFACAWSRGGRHLATAAQDGKIALWDARNWKSPLTSLSCLSGCARLLQFCDDGSLVVGESEDVVSVLAGRCEGFWDRRQDLRFFGALAGLGLLEGGARVVVANADRGVGGLGVWERSAGCDSAGEGWEGFAEGECGLGDVVGVEEGLGRRRKRAGRRRAGVVAEVVV
ncbi:hypothetical protein MBLNU230_g1104t1 [Neophaeotheca triangularis]